VGSFHVFCLELGWGEGMGKKSVGGVVGEVREF
jgi:hypothetical protein